MLPTIPRTPTTTFDERDPRPAAPARIDSLRLTANAKGVGCQTRQALIKGTYVRDVCPVPPFGTSSYRIVAEVERRLVE